MVKKIVKKIIIILGCYKIATRLYDLCCYNLKFLGLCKKILLKLKDSDVYFFFPFFSTGGAEWVHLKIVESSKKNNCVIFTNQSLNSHYLSEFQNYAKCFQINQFISKGIYKKLIIRLLLFKINKSTNCKVFGCNSGFFYDILPFVKPSIIKIDLTHAFTHVNEFGFEKYSLPFVKYLNKRIVISEKVKNDLVSQYRLNNLNSEFENKISVIQNMVGFSCTVYPLKSQEIFNILYVGRNSPEKRIELIGLLATELKKVDQRFNVILIGENLDQGVLLENRKDCIFKGNIVDNELLADEYHKAHCIIIASSREGFPMTIMEGMTFGAIPISTNVGGIYEHVINNSTGMLIPNNSSTLLIDFVDCFKELLCNENKYCLMSKNAFEYAKENFNSDSFRDNYQKLFD